MDVKRAYTAVRERLHLVVPVACAAVIFAVALTAYPPPSMVADAYRYNAAAYRLVTEGVYAYGPDAHEPDVVPNARVTPGQILVLAGAFRVSGVDEDYVASSQRSRRVWQALQYMWALATVLFIALAGHELGGRRLAATAGMAAAFYLPFVWATSVALAESLGVMLVAAQLWLAIRLTSRESTPSVRSALALGVIAGLTAMARPSFIAWILVPLAYAIVVRLASPRRMAVVVLAGALGFCLVFSPWWIRTYHVLERFVPIRTDAVLIDGSYESIGWASPPAADLPNQIDRAHRSLMLPWSAPIDVIGENTFQWSEERVEFAEYPETLLAQLQSWREIVTYYHIVLVYAGFIGFFFLVRRMPQLTIAASVPVYLIAVRWSGHFLDRYLFLAAPALVLLGSIALVQGASRLYAYAISLDG